MTGGLLHDERDHEADEGKCLSERRAHDEDGEDAILDLRLARHGVRNTVSGEADGQTSADNTETVTDNSHNSSFSCMRPVRITHNRYLKRQSVWERMVAPPRGGTETSHA